MIRWLRETWPPGWALVVATLVFLFFQGVVLVVEWVERTPFFSLAGDSEHPIVLIPMGFLAILYAVYRVWAFHPALRPGYYQWLCGTPWTSQKPLPLGPIHLVWQDSLLVAIAVALNWPRLQWHSLAIGGQFLAAYLLVLAGAFVVTGDKLRAYAIGFALGFTCFFANDYPICVGCLAVTYGLALLGLRASLARFPWEGSKAGAKVNDLVDFKPVGWPHGSLGPKFANISPPSLADTLLMGLLAGWWLLATSWIFRALNPQPAMKDDVPMIAVVLYVYFLVFGVAVRLGCYCYRYRPPLSLLGRLMLGRWIIPGYDQVFVAPLLALLVGAAAFAACLWLPVDPIVIAPLALTLTWWILFGMGPSYQVWRTTGNHRIVPGLPTKQFVQ